MKNFAAKLFLIVVVASGLSTVAWAGGTTAAAAERMTRYFRVDAYDTNFHTFYVEPDTRTTIRITGDGDTDLDAYVKDEEGDVIVEDLRTTTDGYLTFFSRYGGLYTVTVDNTGHVYNRYKLEIMN